MYCIASGASLHGPSCSRLTSYDKRSVAKHGRKKFDPKKEIPARHSFSRICWDALVSSAQSQIANLIRSMVMLRQLLVTIRWPVAGGATNHNKIQN